MNRIDAYILAGGKSSRFGNANEDKARALLEGQPLIVRLAHQLSNCNVASITVVADHENKYQDLGLVTIADHQPGLGPLAGLERALTHHADKSPICKHLLLLSCDLLEIRPAWVEILHLHTGHEVITDDDPRPNQVICFTEPAMDDSDKSARLHPLPGLYHQSLLPLISKSLEDRQLGFQRLIRSARHRAIPLPTDWPTLVQINTTTEWDAAQKQIRR